jgi:hypothetical protein
MRVRPFTPSDALDLVVQDSQQLEWHARQKVLARFTDAGNAFTIVDADGRPVFCGGAVEQHADYAQLWAVFAADKRGAMTRVLRATRHFIAGLSHRRIDAPVLDRPEARRWAELLGLTCEARLGGAAHDGGDILIYVRNG